MSKVVELRFDQEPPAKVMPENTIAFSGFAGELIGHFAERAERVSLWHPTAGVLAGLSAATNNRYTYVNPRGGQTSLNVYMLLVSPTGDGKGTALSAASHIADAGSITVSSRVTSDAAMHETLIRDDGRPATVLYLRDEFGRFIKTMRKNAQSHENTLWTLLMELYSEARRKLRARRYAGRKGKDDKPEVTFPFVSCLFVTTDTQLQEILGSEDATDGTLNRIFCIAGPRSTRVPDDAPYVGPFELTPRQRAIVHLMSVGPINGDFPSMDNTVTATKEAQNQLKAYAHLSESKRVGKHGELWVRAYEQTLRLASVLAVADAAAESYDPSLPVNKQKFSNNPIRVDAHHVTESWVFVAAGIKWQIANYMQDADATFEDVLTDRIKKTYRAMLANHEADSKGFVRWSGDTGLKKRSRTRHKGRMLGPKEVSVVMDALVADREFEWAVPDSNSDPRYKKPMVRECPREP